MDKTRLDRLESMRKELERQKYYLNIQLEFVKYFIKKLRDEG